MNTKQHALGVLGALCLGVVLVVPTGILRYAQNDTSVPSVLGGSPGRVRALQDNPNPPENTVKLIFIHHSTGGNWLADPNEEQPSGGLGIALRDNNYYVSATNYGWGPDAIGDRTDIPNWPEWFTGPNRATILNALYRENGQNVGGFGAWSRLSTNPGGENEIIVFKSCFPNSDLYGNPDDPPLSEPNDELTVGNAKAVYNNILTYFATRQDKLFVVITAPPLMESETAPDRAANARALNNWLVNEWLRGYAYRNVAVFDYYNVLTSNGGNADINDAGAETGNHHRWWNGAVQHIQTAGNNFSAYPSGDSHPSSAGQRKATTEFVALLNVFYHRWRSGPSQVTPSVTATRTPTRTATRSATPSITAMQTTSASATPPTATSTARPSATRTASVTPSGEQARPIYLPLILKGGRPPVTPTATLRSTAHPTSTATSQASHEVTIQRGSFGEVRDAYIWASEPDYTGNSESLYTGRYDENYKMTLLRFELSGLPAGATVEVARLSIYQSEGGGERLVRAYRITQDWGEDSVTWNTFTLGDMTVRGSFSAQGQGWKTVEITALVQEWMDGSANHGLALHDEAAGASEYEVYYSSEHEEQDLRPKLYIRWR